MNIYFSPALKQHAALFASQADLATEWGIDDSLFSLLMHDKRTVSATLIAKILNKTGFDFEKAFVVTEEKP